MNAPPPRTLTDFAGRWQIDRRIVPAAGPPAHFSGQAQCTPQDDGLLYTETGQLCVQGHAPMQAERRYWWKSDLSVWFDDGRFFHHIPPGGGATAHWCDPDQYDGHYDFTQWPRFEVIWRVKGPAKDYEMTTTYTPAP